MNEALWEPWQPKIGDEVEVRISAECICPHCGDHAHGERLDLEHSYQGTVWEIHRSDTVGCQSCGKYIPGHFYLIRGVHMGEHPRRAYGWAAAIEMKKVGPKSS